MRDLWDKFMSTVLFTLPFGNDGRGTPFKLFPVVGVIVTMLIAMAINYAIYGNV